MVRTAPMRVLLKRRKSASDARVTAMDVTGAIALTGAIGVQPTPTAMPLQKQVLLKTMATL